METDLAIELWLEHLELEGRSPETLKTYRSLCRPLPKVAPALAEASKPKLSAFIRSYRVDHAPASARSLLVTWQNFFNWCVREEFISESPLRGVRQPKPTTGTNRTGYSSQAIIAVSRHLQALQGPLARRDEAVVAVLLDSGLRVSELCRLQVDDYLESQLLVRVSKTGRPRMVPVGRLCDRAVSRYLRLGRPKLKPACESLFVTERGQTMSRFTVALLLKRIGERTGTPLSAHRFRHTFATEHLRAGTSMESLRRLGGWSTYAMIQTYAHLRTDDLAMVQLGASPYERLTRRR